MSKQIAENNENNLTNSLVHLDNSIELNSSNTNTSNISNPPIPFTQEKSGEDINKHKTVILIYLLVAGIIAAISGGIVLFVMSSSDITNRNKALSTSQNSSPTTDTTLSSIPSLSNNTGNSTTPALPSVFIPIIPNIQLSKIERPIMINPNTYIGQVNEIYKYLLSNPNTLKYSFSFSFSGGPSADKDILKSIEGYKQYVLPEFENIKSLIKKLPLPSNTYPDLVIIDKDIISIAQVEIDNYKEFANMFDFLLSTYYLQYQPDETKSLPALYNFGKDPTVAQAKSLLDIYSKYFSNTLKTFNSYSFSTFTLTSLNTQTIKFLSSYQTLIINYFESVINEYNFGKNPSKELISTQLNTMQAQAYNLYSDWGKSFVGAQDKFANEINSMGTQFVGNINDFVKSHNIALQKYNSNIPTLTPFVIPK